MSQLLWEMVKDVTRRVSQCAVGVLGEQGWPMSLYIADMMPAQEKVWTPCQMALWCLMWFVLDATRHFSLAEPHPCMLYAFCFFIWWFATSFFFFSCISSCVANVFFCFSFIHHPHLFQDWQTLSTSSSSQDTNQALRLCLGTKATGAEFGAVSALSINHDCSRLLCGFAKGQVRMPVITFH